MITYAKLFSRILDSTIWREDDKTRILWITMLAMADKDGIVECTIPGLADRAKISLDHCETALARFQAPDKYSWSKDEEGRRIREVEGGWFLVNHGKYKALLSLEDRRERDAARQRNWRSKQKPVTTRDSCDMSRESRHTDTDTDINTNTKTNTEVHSSIKLDPPTALRASRATRIPESLVPKEEHYLIAKEQGLNCDMQFQVFRDHFLGAPGQRGIKLDWDATFRKWLRSSYNSGGSNGQQQVGKATARAIDNRANILAGLGIGPLTGSSGTGVPARSPAGGSPRLVGDVQD